MYSFDELINRLGSNSFKWDEQVNNFGMEGLLPFWVADSDFKAAPQIIAALRDRVEHGIYGYSNTPKEYRKAASHWLERRHGWSISEEWIVPQCGVVTSISFAIRAFTDPGDKVLIQTPVYGPFFSVVERNKRNLVESPLRFTGERYEMDFEDLEAKCADGVKMMLLCSPHNPSGRVWEKDELERLVEICKKYGVILVSDEIHADLVYKGHKHTTAGSFAYCYNKIVVGVAASKSFNIPGLQTSNAIIPDDKLRELFIREVEASFVPGPDIFGMVATQTAYSRCEDWLDEQLEYLEGNLEALLNYFSCNLPEIKVIKPEGTYLAWLDFRSLKITNKKLMKLLVEKGGISLSEGTIFGKLGEGFMRFNFACPRALMLEGLNRIKTSLTT